MVLEKIILHNFRNFDDSSYTFHPEVTVILGENAQGKTNLLEAVYMSINGEGFRESKEEELLRWGSDKSIIETLWDAKGAKQMFQIFLTFRGDKVEKKYYINKTHKNHQVYRDLQTKAVLFAPEHIEIIGGSPDIRRDYFNKLLSLGDKEYKKNLHNYEQALRRRNKVLEFYSDEQTLKKELRFWNDYLFEHAQYITRKREEYTAYLNKHKIVEKRQFEISYLKNEFTRERLEKVFDFEKRIRRTVIGPQKDDFELFEIDVQKKSIHHYGSRSEQRLGVFWLKLNEIRFFEETFKVRPILLLDDIFSELDAKNKRIVLDLLDRYQTLLTTTEADLVDVSPKPKTVITIKAGKAV